MTAFLDHMQATRAWTPATWNQRLACIRSFFRYAAGAEPVLAVYLTGLSVIPLQKNPDAGLVKYMSTTAVNALLAAPDPATRTGLRDQFFMTLMFDLAARDAEMLGMRLGDLDARRRSADLLGKGAKPRRLMFTDQTAGLFEKYAARFHPDPDPEVPLFYTVRGRRRGPMSDDNVARFIRQHAATARAACPEVPDRVHPHMLRHSRAMQLYRGGMELELLAQWLGHSSSETTLIYARADTEMKRKALDKAHDDSIIPQPDAVWHGNDDIIERLTGLRNWIKLCRVRMRRKVHSPRPAPSMAGVVVVIRNSA